MLLPFPQSLSHRSKLLFVGPLTLFLLFISTLSAIAAPGDLDPSFAGSGISQPAGISFFGSSSIAVQSDGKIIVGNTTPYPNTSAYKQFALVRYLSNGLLDPSFGANGRVITNFNEYPAYNISLRDVTILPNGKIVAIGSGQLSYNNIQGIYLTYFVVVRYNTDGSLDTTFNNTGKFLGGIDLSSPASAVIAQPDNKFIVVGYGGGTYKGPPTPYKILLYRFSDSGLDSSFGNGGKVVTQFQDGNAYGYSIAIQPNGKIVVGGYSYSASVFGLSLTRYESNGNLDSSFGDNGFVVFSDSNLENISGVAIQPNGKIVAIATSQNTSNNIDFAVFQFNENGLPDLSFGTNGKVKTDVSGIYDKASAVVLQPDGKIIVAGSSYNYTTSSKINPALVRYNPNGSLDATFGSGGIVTVPAGYGLSDAALQTDGKILAVGGSGVLRYLGDAPFNLRRTNFDFDGDGWADFAVTRKIDANFNWYVIENPSGVLLRNVEWGTLSDILVPADFDGDGRTDVAVFRPSDGTWYVLQSSNNSIQSVKFGQNGDVPIPADFDGDGRADYAVFRRGIWFILNSSNSGFRAEQFGIADDKPLIADFDGDGRADISVYRSGTWYSQRSTAGFFAAQFGLADDTTVPADYDGDGKTDLAVYRPSNGTWYLQNSFEGFKAFQFGIASDQPAPADYDGDGKTDIAVLRDGVWFVRNAGGDLRAINFGNAGDQPVPAVFQR